MERKNMWKVYSAEEAQKLEDVCNRYKDCRERYIDPHWLLNIK